jgi:hypothetical protein
LWLIITHLHPYVPLNRHGNLFPTASRIIVRFGEVDESLNRVEKALYHRRIIVRFGGIKRIAKRGLKTSTHERLRETRNERCLLGYPSRSQTTVGSRRQSRISIRGGRNRPRKVGSAEPTRDPNEKTFCSPVRTDETVPVGYLRAGQLNWEDKSCGERMGPKSIQREDSKFESSE